MDLRTFLLEQGLVSPSLPLFSLGTVPQYKFICLVIFGALWSSLKTSVGILGSALG